MGVEKASGLLNRLGEHFGEEHCDIVFKDGGQEHRARWICKATREPVIDEEKRSAPQRIRSTP